MEFKDIGLYKEKISQLLKDSDLNNLLTELIAPGIISSLPFPYQETGAKPSNFICIDCNISKNRSTTKEMQIELSIVFHKSLAGFWDNSLKERCQSLGYAGTRLDIAAAVAGDILNNSRKFGIGTLKPAAENPVQSYFPENFPDYLGKLIVYHCDDFMRNCKERI